MLTLESKKKLSSTVRTLRTLLLRALREEADREYRLGLPLAQAALPESRRVRRERLEAWLDARVSRNDNHADNTRARLLDEAVEGAAATLVQRLFVVRLLEGAGLVKPAVLTGGAGSKGVRALREAAPELLLDESEGHRWLLSQLFDELSLELPALFAPRDPDVLFALPAGTLRTVLAALDDPGLNDVWDDDTTLGWVYQFWNDPAREAIDERLSRKGRVEQHEIACKTQLFTERYMVEWLLVNTLGRVWLALCQNRGWHLEERQRIVTNPTGPWRYYCDRPLDESELDAAPRSLQEIRLLDPASGSGHFLVIALEMLHDLYAREAKYLALLQNDNHIVETILANNISGIELDPRAAQCACASLYLAARRLAPGVRVPPFSVLSPTAMDGLDASAARLGTLFRPQEKASGALVELLRPERYHLVVGNPPYLSSSKRAGYDELKALYPEGHADLFAAFFLRGLELLRPGGYLGYATLSNWLYLGSFERLRGALLSHDLVALAELGKGAFSQASLLINTAMTVLRKAPPVGHTYALRAQPGDEGDEGESSPAPERIAGALASHSGALRFDTRALAAIEGSPVLFWLERGFLERYRAAPRLGSRARLQPGIATYDNGRFLRLHWELAPLAWRGAGRRALPYLKGARGRGWFDAVHTLLCWRNAGLELRLFAEHAVGATLSVREPAALGLAYSTIGNRFSARLHRVPSVLDVSGASVFAEPATLATLLCALNRTETRRFLEALNPTVNFQLSDVARAPAPEVPDARAVVDRMEQAFSLAESVREGSVDFRAPGPSAWAAAQRWAQRAVDRAPGEPLADFEPESEAALPETQLSFALGVALGRFDAKGGGVLERAPASALPEGLLFLSEARGLDGLAHPACAALHKAWRSHGDALGQGRTLRSWLCHEFFALHRATYENRPIWWPLSSSKHSFVVWMAVHRLTDRTLKAALAEHLLPEQRALESELEDVRRARREGEPARRAGAEKRHAELTRLCDEMRAFVLDVRACAEQGPPPSDASCPARERDAPLRLALEDGVRVNASALWPLLEPQWKDPRRWWRELCVAEGRRALSWSKLAGRYFPKRVAAACALDPSLAAAHACLWRLHPALAYEWELRLQHEVGADFVLDEPDAAKHRARFLRTKAAEASRLAGKEKARRERKPRPNARPTRGA